MMIQCLFFGPTSLLNQIYEHPKFSQEVKKSSKILRLVIICYSFMGWSRDFHIFSLQKSKANRFERTSLGDIAGGAKKGFLGGQGKWLGHVGTSFVKTWAFTGSLTKNATLFDHYWDICNDIYPYIYPIFMDLGLSESRLGQNFGSDCRCWFSFTNNTSINHLFLG